MSNVLDNLIVELIETHDPIPHGNISPDPEIDPAPSSKIKDVDKTSPEIRYNSSPLTKSRLTDSMMTLGFDRG